MTNVLAFSLVFCHYGSWVQHKWMCTYLRESGGRRMLVVTELLTEKEGVTEMRHLLVIFAKLCSQNTMCFIIYFIHTLKVFYWFLYYIRYCIFIFSHERYKLQNFVYFIFFKKNLDMFQSVHQKSRTDIPTEAYIEQRHH